MIQWATIIGALAVGTAVAAGLIVKDAIKARGKKVVKLFTKKNIRRP